MGSFDRLIENQQIQWRKKHIAISDCGSQNGIVREWILPYNRWEEGLWCEIRSNSKNSLPDYLKEGGINKHEGVHNLKSSWTLCANLYFPFKKDSDLLAGFLKQHISKDIESVEAIELEFEEQYPLCPKELLGEPDGGTRGKNQTSPDIAFKVKAIGNTNGLILVENKFTEHSFYDCSGHKAEDNRAPERCLDVCQILNDFHTGCYQLNWEKKGRPNRKYWENLKISEYGRNMLKSCPAAIAGYQLFRQQALAEGIAKSRRYDFVFSCVAYDERNSELIGCMKKNGISDFRTVWGRLFDGKTIFATFSHQQWVAWVRSNDKSGEKKSWLAYVQERYEI